MSSVKRLFAPIGPQVFTDNVCIICTEKLYTVSVRNRRLPNNTVVEEESFTAQNPVWSIAPCGHAFHIKCIAPWCTNNVKCPQCRLKIDKNDLTLLRKKRYKAKVTYENGDVYEGNFKNGDHNGEGKMTYANGDVYIGWWEYNVRNGQGKMIYANGDVYEGEFLNEKYFGKGKMKYANGDIYEGNWRFGKKNGKGKMTYEDGKVYKGQWKNGKKNG